VVGKLNGNDPEVPDIHVLVAMNSFPFSDPDPKKLSQLADSIWKASTVLDVIKSVQTVSNSSDSSFYLIQE
jgi:hypothetical protein